MMGESFLPFSLFPLLFFPCVVHFVLPVSQNGSDDTSGHNGEKETNPTENE